jgi:hypothetical protein
MYRHTCILLAFFCGFYGAQAQYFKISGKITNDKLEPLALVSIQVKGSVKGTISKKMAVMSCVLKKEPMILHSVCSDIKHF